MLAVYYLPRFIGVDVATDKEYTTNKNVNKLVHEREVHAQNHGKMQEEEFVGGFANRAQADNDEEGESTNGEGSSLDRLRLERFWFQAKE